MAASVDVKVSPRDGSLPYTAHVEMEARELPPHTRQHLEDTRQIRDMLAQITQQLDDHAVAIAAAPPATEAALHKALDGTWARLESVLEPVVKHLEKVEHDRAVTAYRSVVEQQVRAKVLTAGALFGAARAEFRWTGERALEVVVKNAMGVQLHPRYFGCAAGSFTL